jgi:hypothetical protein
MRWTCSRKTLGARAIDYLFVSTHNPSLHGTCVDVLRGAGLEIIAAADLHDTYSYDGLIVARRADLPGLGSVQISLKSVHGLRA